MVSTAPGCLVQSRRSARWAAVATRNRLMAHTGFLTFANAMHVSMACILGEHVAFAVQYSS